MDDLDIASDLGLNRRKLLAAAGLSGGLLAVSTEASAAPTAESPVVRRGGAPRVDGLHLQFGSDAATQMTVSWHTLQAVSRPRVLIGRLDGRLVKVVEAKTVTYTDGKSKQVVYAHHASIDGLRPDRAYLYAALHDGSAPEFGTFRTGPRGRAPFTFTSFGDQARRRLASSTSHRWVRRFPSRCGSTIISARRRRVTRRWAWSVCAPCFICSTAICATPTWRKTASAPGGISGRTIAAAPATGPGCRRRAITKTSSAMGRSAIRPTRPISACAGLGPDGDHPRSLVRVHGRKRSLHRHRQ